MEELMNRLEKKRKYESTPLTKNEGKIIGYYLFKFCKLLQQDAHIKTFLIIAEVIYEGVQTLQENFQSFLQFINQATAQIPQANKDLVFKEIQEYLDSFTPQVLYDLGKDNPIIFGAAPEYDANVINLVYLQKQDNQIFLKLIENYFMADSPSLSLSNNPTIPQDIQQRVNSLEELDFLRKDSDFSQAELQYIHVLYYAERFEPLKKVSGGLSETIYHPLFHILEIPKQEYKQMLNRYGRLQRYFYGSTEFHITDYDEEKEKLLEENPDFFPREHWLPCNFAETIFTKKYESLEYDFQGPSNQITFPSQPPVLSLEDFELPEDIKATFLKILTKEEPAHLMIYDVEPQENQDKIPSAPITDRMDLALALAQAANLSPIIYQPQREIMGGLQMTNLEFLAAMPNPNRLIIIPIAERILNAGYGVEDELIKKARKEDFDSLIKHNKAKIMWIPLYMEELHSHFVPQMDFTYNFYLTNGRYQYTRIGNKLLECHLDRETTLQLFTLMGQYVIQGELLDNLISLIQSSKIQEKNLPFLVEQVIQQYIEFLHNPRRTTLMIDSFKESKRFGTDAVILKLASMIHSLSDSPAIRLMFFGFKESEKTKLAQFIMRFVGKKAITKDLSQITDSPSSWQQVIRNAFEEAQNQDSALILENLDDLIVQEKPPFDIDAVDRELQKLWGLDTLDESQEKSVPKKIYDEDNPEIIKRQEEFLKLVQEFKGILVCIANKYPINTPLIYENFHALLECTPYAYGNGSLGELLKEKLKELDYDPEE